MRSTAASSVSRNAARRAFRAALGLALALVAPALVAIPAGASDPAPATLAALLAGFRTMPGFEARFEEEKTLALLAAPLSSRGRLYFDPPATLLRRVELPNPHAVLVRDHFVRISTPRDVAAPGPATTDAAGGWTVETIDLSHRDDVRPLVESMLWIFSGDLAQIESVYAIDYQVLRPGESGRWRLRLAPRDAPLSHLIRSVSISGRGHDADRLEVEESSGDRTTMRILDADTGRRFAPGEIERLFESARP